MLTMDAKPRSSRKLENRKFVSVFVLSGFQHIVLRKLTEVVILWVAARLLRPTLVFVDSVFLVVFGKSLEKYVCFDLVLKFFELGLVLHTFVNWFGYTPRPCISEILLIW